MTNAMQIYNDELHLYITGYKDKAEFVIWSLYPVVTIPHPKYGDKEYVIGHIPFDDYRRVTFNDASMLDDYNTLFTNKLAGYMVQEFTIGDGNRTIRQLMKDNTVIGYWAYNVRHRRLDIGIMSEDKARRYDISVPKGNRKKLTGTDILDSSSKITLYKLDDLIYSVYR